MKALSLLALVVLASCSTQKSFEVTSAQKEGIAFKAHFREFSGSADPDLAVNHAFQYAGKQVARAAHEKGQTLSSVVFVEGEAYRGMLSGNFTVDVEGRALYGKAPFTGIPFEDRGGIIRQAYASVARSRAVADGLNGISAGLNQASQSFNAQTQLSIQAMGDNQRAANTNYQLQQLNNSIRENTQATQALSSSVNALR